MNQTLDYSFENTPVSIQQANGSQVPRVQCTADQRCYDEANKLFPRHNHQQASHSCRFPFETLFLLASHVLGLALMCLFPVLQTVPRKPVPNWGMPAYIDGALAWGSPPKQQAVSAAPVARLGLLRQPSL